MNGRSTSKSNKTPIHQAPNSTLSALLGGTARKSGLDADWNAIHPTVLANIIWAIDYFGGATTFSTTKNGNAYCIKVYLGAPFEPRYFDGDDDGRAEMQAWAEGLVAAAAEQG